MADTEFCLVGSRPPSNQGFYRPTSAISNAGIDDTFDISMYRTPTPSSSNIHHAKTKLNSTKTKSSQCNTPKRTNSSKERASTHLYKFPYQENDKDKANKNKHKESYVDETLFGSSHPNEANFPAPWESKYYKQDITNGRYHLNAFPHTMQYQGKRTAKPRKQNSQSSFVDESLFGDLPKEADFPAPWETHSSRRPKQYVMDATDYKAKPQNRSVDKAANRTSYNSRPSSARKIFQKSFVDETLFGAPPEEASFEAPWSEKKSFKQRPLVFDGANHYRQSSSNAEAQPPSRSIQVSVSIRKPIKQEKPTHIKPAWK